MVFPRFVTNVESDELRLRLAVLINADNAQASVIVGFLAEFTRFRELRLRAFMGISKVLLSKESS